MNYILKVITFILAMLGALLLFTVMHEETHKIVSQYYGCENITISFGDFDQGQFMHNDQICDFQTEAKYLSWLETQSMNDLIFVGITCPIFLIGIFMLAKHFLEN